MTEPDIRKIFNQHIETERFFAGDFTIADLQAQPGPELDKKHDNGQKENTSESVGAKSAILDQIAQQVCACRACPLGNLRKNAVPGEGNPDARIVFVGEAPGGDEDIQGRPFVGRAGQLLDKIISNAMGLKREDVFICNILKCRPPDNRDPKAEEIIACLPFLQQQLEIIKPEIIIALGAHAARTLLNTNKPIGQLRGMFHEYYPSVMAQPVKLMATFHPAYLLRSYSRENRQRVWEDVKKVLVELNLPIP